MRKPIVAALALVAIVLIGSSASALVTVPGESKRNSYGAVWDAVIDLQGQILELKGLVLELQQKPGPQGEKGDKGDRGDPGFCSTDSSEYRALQERIVVLEQLAGVECTAGQTQECYTGSPETEGVGACQGGTQSCVNSKWSACVGQVLPAVETCNGQDDDCDGETDEGSSLCTTAHGTAACIAGACGEPVCDAGFGNCDGNAVNGCELNTASNPMNCGACGNICPSVQGANSACVAGQCTLACMSGFANCDASSDKSCETNTNTDANNCGWCGHSCDLANAESACAGGNCQVTRCTSGYVDCNNFASDGCEANVMTDARNCGACGKSCYAGQLCSAGACTYPTSCMELHQAYPSWPTGSYTLKIGGVLQTVCCDMTTNGGGYPCA